MRPLEFVAGAVLVALPGPAADPTPPATTGGLSTACFPLGSPGHGWQNVAAIGSPIGHKEMMAASKVPALSLAELLQDDAVRKEAKADFEKRLAGRKYTTRVPKGQKPPPAIR